MIAGSLSLPLSAEEGLVYPDTARVAFYRQVDFDTVTVTIQNLSGDSLRNLFLSDFTDSQADFIQCRIDGLPVDSLPMDLEFGSVYPGKFSTRWIVGDFADNLVLKYYSAAYGDYLLSWSAGHPYPIFGILPGIGPPIDPAWHQ